ncbi:MAG: hypothetical protein MUC31_01310 [Bacteroidales bacterium]|nr:hypothetical protein [Bacteroidales bacterium]
MNIVFFKRPRPRQFNYQPLYYDPAKEEAEERKKARNSAQEGDIKEHMRAEIRRKWKIDRNQSARNNQMPRIIIYVIFSLFIIYFLFFTDFVTKLVSLFLR